MHAWRSFVGVKKETASSRLRRTLTWLFWLLREIEPIAVLLVFLTFVSELGYRHEERVARAWQLVTTKAGGNSGKIEALEYLNSEAYWFFQDWLQFAINRGWLPSTEEQARELDRWLSINLPFTEEQARELDQWLSINLPFTKRPNSLRGIDLTPPRLDEQWKAKPKQKQVLSDECQQFGYVYLQSVKLAEAELGQATLVCSNLSKADLERADLQDADLRGANLRGAILERADLQDADLRGAILETAGLRDADLRDADLREADLREADLRDADLQDTDLRETKGIFCPQLKKATNWESACRDKKLACEASRPPIPFPEKPCHQQQDRIPQNH